MSQQIFVEPEISEKNDLPIDSLNGSSQVSNMSVNDKPSLGGLGLPGGSGGTELSLDNDDLIVPNLPNFNKRRFAMSTKRFIKFTPNEEFDWLIENHPIAFLLLTIVAKRCRRTPNSPDGRLIGEALIGDYKSFGVTRQKYRTALKILCDKKFLKIIETCRTRKKSTNGSTTKGTKVSLLRTDIYDPCFEDFNQYTNHRPTTDQPPTNHEQECKECKIGKKYIVPKGTLARTAKSRPRNSDLLKFSFDSGTYEGITEKDREDWRIAYPAINLDQQIASSIQWLKSNPTKAKSKTQWRKFLTGWLARSNEKATNQSAYTQISPKQPVDRRQRLSDGSLANGGGDLF